MMLSDIGVLPPDVSEKSWEQLWEERKSQIIDTLKAHCDIETDEDLAEALEREKVYLQKVVGKIKQAMEENPEKRIVILFDIDGTLVAPDKDWSSERKVLRPAIPILFESILKPHIGERIRTGFLTNRWTEDSLRRFGDPRDGLSYLKEYMSPELLFSTVSVQRELEDFYESEEGYDLENLSRALPPKIRSNPKVAELIATSQPDIEKLVALERILATFDDDVCTVVVDDLYYPYFLNESAGVYGVGVGSESYLAPPRGYRERREAAQEKIMAR